MNVKHGLLRLREKRRLRVFVNRMLRQIFGPKEDANGEWRRLHNEELHSLYCSPNIVTISLEELDWQVMQPEWMEVGVLSKF